MGTVYVNLFLLRNGNAACESDSFRNDNVTGTLLPMSRTPGRNTDSPRESDYLAPPNVDIRDITQSYLSIANALENAALRAESLNDAALTPRGGIEAGFAESLRAEAWREAEEAAEVMMKAIRSARSNFEYWERVTAQYAMEELGFTQRRTAALLGIGVNTVNRWANHPVETRPEEE